MKAYELGKLLDNRMMEKGLGGKEINTEWGHKNITDVKYCNECDQFHIYTEDVRLSHGSDSTSG